jgi:glycosyltransferase involved in cell wall biosynthesis
MKIVIVSAVYPPEPVVSAQMGRDLAVFLAKHGAQVTVLCPVPSRPMGTGYEAFPMDRGPQRSFEDGVEVVRLPSCRSPQSSLLARMRESFSFGRHVCSWLKKRSEGVDVVYANTWPLLSQALIVRYCERRGIPLVLQIMDIYPEALLNRLSGPWRGIVAPPLVALDRWSARHARSLVVISENMRRVYVQSRGLPEGKIETITAWVDEARFDRLPGRDDACARYGVPADRFTFLYLGNIGPVAGVELLIDAFHDARLRDAQLIIAGGGSAKAACVDRAGRLGPMEVRFVSDADAASVPLLQSLGRICLLPVKKGAGMSSIPSKLMAYMLSARPLIATVDAESDTARCVVEAGCGWVGEPEDVAWLAAKMTEAARLPANVLDEMGQRGREYGLKHFSKTKGVARLAGAVMGAAAGRMPSARPRA